MKKQSTKIYLAFLLLVFLMTNNLKAQVPADSDLFKTLFTNDSLLFEVAFNTCDTLPLRKLLSEDLEFYHDQSGITDSKSDFITSIAEGLCKMDYKAQRKLIAKSLKVFPMYNNGTLYAALQSGDHEFYAIYPDKTTAELTSTASFTHLWRLEGEEWKLSRVYSFDHH